MSKPIALVFLALVAAPAFASPASTPSASPSLVTPAASGIGTQREQPWQKHYAIGQLSGDLETSIGRWSTDRPPNGSAWLTQAGPTPVVFLQLRYTLHIR